eukprot:gene2949-2157_t
MQTEFLLSLIDDKATQPSLFEIYFLESITDLLKPALRHLFVAFGSAIANSTTSTAALYWLALAQEHFDTLFFAVQLAADAVSLFGARAGRYVERLYQLERVSTDAAGGPAASMVMLNLAQRVCSLLLCVVLPKVADWLRSVAAAVDASAAEPAAAPSETRPVGTIGSAASSWTDAWRAQLCRLQRGLIGLATRCLRAVATLLPLATVGGQSAVLLCRLLYVMGLTPFHHPIFALLRMKLVKSRYVDAQLASANGGGGGNWPLKLIFSSIFALRGVEWFLHQDFAEDHLSSRLHAAEAASASTAARGGRKPLAFPSPPPPAKGGLRPQLLTDGASAALAATTQSTASASADADSDAAAVVGRCPLCRQPRRHATATPSGFVFCFRCVSAYVHEHRRCPVTHLPCAPLDLVRLYATGGGGGDSGGAAV